MLLKVAGTDGGVSEDEAKSLEVLIERLQNSKPLSPRQSEHMRTKRAFEFRGDDRDIGRAIAHARRYRATAFDITPPLGEFYGKIADQDLGWNVLFLGRLFDDWFANAHSVPPHWANRICVLLRKNKLFDLEREFLAAYLPHNDTSMESTTTKKLFERASKIGAL